MSRYGRRLGSSWAHSGAFAEYDGLTGKLLHARDRIRAERGRTARSQGAEGREQARYVAEHAGRNLTRSAGSTEITLADCKIRLAKRDGFPPHITGPARSPAATQEERKMPKESKKDAPAGKPAPKGQGKAAAQPVAQTTKNQRDNRYLRAARVIIKAGEGEATDPMRIVAEAQLSAASAAYCLEAFKGVTAALREAGILPAKAASAERPNVPAEEAAEAAA